MDSRHSFKQLLLILQRDWTGLIFFFRDIP